MKIRVACGCGKVYRVGGSSAGKSIPCRSCGSTVPVPDPSGLEEGAEAGFLASQYRLGATREELIEQATETGVDEAERVSDLVIGHVDAEDLPDLSAFITAQGLDQPVSRGGSSGGVTGWMIWILILLGANFLSAIFDWPFWIY